MRGLLVIDVQNDFLTGGTMAVPRGDLIIPAINQISQYFDCVVATQDWHPENHMSFAANHPNQHPYETILINQIEQTLWPKHCIQGTWGAALHVDLNLNPVAAIFRKGMQPDVDTYSAFYDNDHQISTGLTSYLHAKKIKDLYVCGLCADICVYYSIKDALAAGFSCYLIMDATCPLNAIDFQRIQHELKTLGVISVTTQDILDSNKNFTTIHKSQNSQPK